MQGLLQKIVWRWAGVDPFLLGDSGLETQRRYTSLGLLLFFIFGLCFLSGLFAFEWVFGHPAIALAFAVFWSLVVYNLYRFLLSTVDSGLLPSSTQGAPQPFSLLIRYGFLVFLAMLISKPIELFFYHFWVEAGVLEGSFDGRQLGSGMAQLHDVFPYTWIFTLMAVAIFLWPFVLKRSFAGSCVYEKRRAAVEIKLIKEDYQRFQDRYQTLLGPFGVANFSVENDFLDPPFNTQVRKDERIFQKKGTLKDWAKNRLKKP